MDKQFFKKLSEKNNTSINELAVQTHNEVFKKIDCLDCGNCCKSAPPIVTSKDIKRIAKFLNLSQKQVKRKHILEDINGELSFDRIPCYFLGEDNKCSIYEARPDACRKYPHTNHDNFTQFRRLHVVNIKICPAVEQIIEIMETKLHELPPS